MAVHLLRPRDSGKTKGETPADHLSQIKESWIKMVVAALGLLMGWCLFSLVLLAVLVFEYQSQWESEVISTIPAIFASAVALLSSALLPVDIAYEEPK